MIIGLILLLIFGYLYIKWARDKIHEYLIFCCILAYPFFWLILSVLLVFVYNILIVRDIDIAIKIIGDNVHVTIIYTALYTILWFCVLHNSLQYTPKYGVKYGVSIGDPISLFILGARIIRDAKNEETFKEGLSYLNKSADAGCHGAIFLLFIYYGSRYKFGVPNDNKLKELYQKYGKINSDGFYELSKEFYEFAGIDLEKLNVGNKSDGYFQFKQLELHGIDQSGERFKTNVPPKTKKDDIQSTHEKQKSELDDDTNTNTSYFIVFMALLIGVLIIASQVN